ncbi:protein downstream neighbor of son homolog [Tribolium castaneum]|uniref:Protein downstream neighbor of son homolog-like Protein n=1 Tax=Tribolium castaneum TaxID=7070 RepID=D6WA58_TRICA|nr:PREDICTED: protein downstream neighbor of son homolog [Tribolium castaneum]EEZ98590.1 Protein downstream neighbor of son homolog-like Protein [Tribolium castaneum]|eukprot:XP_968878.1 PREDICTED: protein downstream neighbor of son homolog [Tribolium castaneum]
MPQSPKKPAPKWHHPSEVMKLHKLKMKKKALQARIAGGTLNTSLSDAQDNKNAALEDIISAKKRKNPFVKTSESKKCKQDVPSSLDESTDQTLFKLLHQSTPSTTCNLTSFENILKKEIEPEVVVVKAQGQNDIPIDWTLKTKIRLWSEQQFSWSQKLKISEEASGTTGFVRCLDQNTDTNLNISPNSKFHQCCLYWQQPSLPWLTLFPRASGKVSESDSSIVTSVAMKTALQEAWKDSLKSLFQLIRTKQCPYFYVCSNNFTVLFRAAGISGMGDIHALVTPTTRGFRQMLRQEDIEFKMPLKKKRTSDQGYETFDSATGESPEDEESPDEQWLQSMGINADDIKQINYTQAKIVHKAECEVDNSEQSLVLIEGVEVHALYNFLINCKSATSLTGPLAGIPPTLLAPVAFNGATLRALKVRESKVHVDNSYYHSLEISGPILPSTIHNLFSINQSDHSMSATFVNVASTLPFSKVLSNEDQDAKRNFIFDKENLSDCGLSRKILGQFCKADVCVTNVECLKYSGDNKTYTWT